VPKIPWRRGLSQAYKTEKELATNWKVEVTAGPTKPMPTAVATPMAPAISAYSIAVTPLSAVKKVQAELASWVKDMFFRPMLQPMMPNLPR